MEKKVAIKVIYRDWKITVFQCCDNEPFACEKYNNQQSCGGTVCTNTNQKSIDKYISSTTWESRATAPRKQ